MRFSFFLISVLLMAISIDGLGQKEGINGPSLIILGNVQDAGSPQLGCKKDCCLPLINKPDPDRMVVSIGIYDPMDNATFLIEATPDFRRQVNYLQSVNPNITSSTPNGIFLSHAHFGHYTGLMYLGRESMNAEKVPVFVMPRMKKFLEENGPWNLLIELNNIVLYSIENLKTQNYTDNIKITPFLVPHREEFSETAGFLIQGPSKKAIFIPDIDKWSKWETDIVKYITEVDYAFLDATFFDVNEVNNRDLNEIPHPFVIESMKLFEGLSAEDKSKIHFIHMNHTNPLLNEESPEHKLVIDSGYNVAKVYDVFDL